MKKIGLSGVLLAAGLAYRGRGVGRRQDGRRRSDHRPQRLVRRAVDAGRRPGGRGLQQVRRHPRPEDHRSSRATTFPIPSRASRSPTSIVGDGVKFVVGHFNSGVTIPASEVYADNGVLFITPSATNPKVTDRKLWDAFRTCGRDDQQGKLWADLALGKLKDKKIAILHDKTPYGQGLADAAQGLHERRRQEGSALRRRQRRREGLFGRRLQAQGVAAPIIVMWGGLHTEGGLIVRQMRDQGLKTVMISGDGITDDEFAQIGGPGVEGTLMSFGPDPRNNPNAKDGQSPSSRPRASIPRATRCTATPRCRSSRRRPRRPSRSTRRRWPPSCTRASRSTP